MRLKEIKGRFDALMEEVIKDHGKERKKRRELRENAMNCKAQLEGVDAEETEVRYGNGLGISQVKTIEEALVVHDRNWDEALFFKEKPPPATAGQPLSRWSTDAVSRYGTIQDQGNNSAIPPLRHKVMTNGSGSTNEALMADTEDMGVTNENEKDGVSLGVFDAANRQNMNEVIDIGSNTSEIAIMAAPHLMGPTNNSLHSSSDMSTVAYSTPSQAQYPIIMTHVIATSPESSALIMNQQYLVESPSVPAIKAASIPLAGLSPLSAVTSGLNRIQLKRH
ncbi:hypothetical protein K1719_015874 [Acacia pycnantha]|nr:hypothetical protein K1719_015874 [Acacia pycnantha]